jgi:HEAT repeat protein
MRHFSFVRTSFPLWVGLAVLMAGPGWTPGPSAQAPRDPVLELRDALASTQPESERGPRVREAVARLRTVRDLTQALSAKSAWKAQDQKLKVQIAERLRTLIRAGVNSRNPMARIAAADLLSTMGTTIVAVEPRTGHAKEMGQGESLGRAKPAGQADNAGRAKGKGQGNPEAELPNRGPDTDSDTNPQKPGEGPPARGGLARTFTPELVQLIHDRDPRVRIAALLAFGKINPPPDVAVAELRPLLQSRAGNRERRAAAQVLVELMREVTRKKAPNLLGVEAAPEEAIALGEQVVPLAARGMADLQGEVRRLCAEAVELAAGALSTSSLLPPEAAPVIVPPVIGAPKTEARDSQDLLFRRAQQAEPLVRALSKQGPLLARRLQNDSDPAVRLLVLRTLEDMANARRRLTRLGKAGARPVGALGDGMKDSVAVLAGGINDPVVRLRLTALNFLELLEDRAAPAAGALVESLGDRDKFVRWAAARILGKIGKPVAAAVPSLTRMLGSDVDLDLRKEAADTLTVYGPRARRAVPSLIAATRAEDTLLVQKVLQALNSIGTKALGKNLSRTVDAVARTLGHTDPQVRKTAAETLGRFGADARRAAPALQRALRDEDETVRQAAGEALLSIELAEK